MIYLIALICHLFGNCTEYATKEEDEGKCCICGKKMKEKK